MITKRELKDGASTWPRAALPPLADRRRQFAAHIQDTLVAGAICATATTTRYVVENAPAARLAARPGVPFTLEATACT